MAKLIDIKGYWCMPFIREFNENDMWEGKILLEADGWFEGIVVDPNSSYTEDRFIFGVYHPNKVIELFKFTPVKVSSPFVFHGQKDFNFRGYEGQFEAIGIFGTMPCGGSRIITQDIELNRDDVDLEIQQLQSKIKRYKDTIMDDVGKSFYGNSIAMRNSMCQVILRNYEGRGFTAEETEQIAEECQPVNDRVAQATEEEAKRLVKTMPKKAFLMDEDDLPF